MNILVIATSNAWLGDRPTGLWLEEFALPYAMLRAAGATITVASPQGGPVPIDPKTAPSERQRTDWTEALQALSTSHRLTQIRPEGYDAVFIPGGHGPLGDLVADADVQRLVAAIDRAGGVVAAVCHGSAALVEVRRDDGTPLVAGRRVTGFTNLEERLAGLADKVPFLLQDRLKERQGDFHAAMLPFMSHVEVDGNLVTGQNPQSSKAVGQALLTALAARKPVA